jgi:hypothetical protein
LQVEFAQGHALISFVRIVDISVGETIGFPAVDRRARMSIDQVKSLAGKHASSEIIENPPINAAISLKKTFARAVQKHSGSHAMSGADAQN